MAMPRRPARNNTLPNPEWFRWKKHVSRLKAELHTVAVSGCVLARCSVVFSISVDCIVYVFVLSFAVVRSRAGVQSPAFAFGLSSRDSLSSLIKTEHRRGIFPGHGDYLLAKHLSHQAALA
jgi:hypothetical protein